MRRAYEISDDLVDWITDYAARLQIDKSQLVDIALSFGLPAISRVWEADMSLKGVRAIQLLLHIANEELLLQPVDKESISKLSAKRYSEK